MASTALSPPDWIGQILTPSHSTFRVPLLSPISLSRWSLLLQCGAGPWGFAFKDDMAARLRHLTRMGNPSLNDLGSQQGCAGACVRPRAMPGNAGRRVPV